MIIQPGAVGPLQFGVSKRASTGNTKIPGAFGITWIEARSGEEKERIAD